MFQSFKKLPILSEVAGCSLPNLSHDSNVPRACMDLHVFPGNAWISTNSHSGNIDVSCHSKKCPQNKEHLVSSPRRGDPTLPWLSSYNNIQSPPHQYLWGFRSCLLERQCLPTTRCPTVLGEAGVIEYQRMSLGGFRRSSRYSSMPNSRDVH